MATGKARREAQQQINKAMEEGNDIAKALGQTLQEHLNTGNRLTKDIKDRAKTLDVIVQSQSSNEDIQKKILTLQNRAKQVGDAALKTEIQRLRTQLASTDAIKGQADSMMKGLRSAISTVEGMPGGEFLINKLGFGPQNMAKIEDNLTEILSGGKKWGQLFEGTGKASAKMAAKLGAAAASIGIAVALFKTFKSILTSFSEVVDQVGAQFGVMGAQDLAAPMVDSRAEALALGKDVGDLIGITSSLSSEFGIGASNATKMSAKILDSSVAMGLSADEGAKLFGTLMQIGGLTVDQAENLAESTYQLARANNVAPAAVMRDIAENSQVIAKFGAHNLDSITKSAIQARKMGLNLGDVETIASSLLDFQTSLAAEVEASVLIGKDLNFQRARELALVGDMSGMMNTVLDQLGGEAEFNKLNVIQRQSLAKSLGLEVKQMNKLVQGQKGLTGESKSFSDLLGKDAIANLTAILNKFKTIGAEIVKRVAPILNDMANDFQMWMDSGGWEKVMGFVESVAGALKWIATHPKTVGALLGALAGFSVGGLKGAVIGGLAGAGGMAMMGMADGGSFVTSGPTPIMTGDNPGGKELVSVTPLGLGGGVNMDMTPVAREVATLKNEMTELRNDMRNYFGFGGSVAKQIGRENLKGTSLATHMGDL